MNLPTASQSDPSKLNSFYHKMYCLSFIEEIITSAYYKVTFIQITDQ